MPASTFSKPRPKKLRRKKQLKPTTRVKGYQLNKALKQVKRMIPRPEWKSFDVARAATTITTTATLTNLAAMSPGTGESDFVGDKVRMKSVLLRMSITPNATAGVNYLRVIVFRDKQSNVGTPPTAATLLQVATNYLSPLNNDNGMRFKVMYDQTFTVDTDANGAQVQKLYRRLNYVSEFQAGVAIPITNSTYILEISDQAANGPSVQWYSRVRYTDV